MKRHRVLVPLSHDHHHALREARLLRQASTAETEERRGASRRFVRFFLRDTISHFREEEEKLYPVLVDGGPTADDLLVRALLEHQRLHALVARLDAEAERGSADPGLMQATATLLEQHVRLEERELFPLIERRLGDETLQVLDVPGERPVASAAIDLLAPAGRGPLWGTETEDLNATLLAWGPSEGSPEHVNRERDVVIVVLAGSATVAVGADRHHVEAGGAVVIPKGERRSVSPGPDGVRYLSIHRRRPPLRIGASAGARTQQR